MMQSVRTYADYCRRRGIEFSSHVLHMATFFGPDEWWRESFVAPKVTETIATKQWKPPKVESGDVPRGHLTQLLGKALRR